jgi:hypothetical protein
VGIEQTVAEMVIDDSGARAITPIEEAATMEVQNDMHRLLSMDSISTLLQHKKPGAVCVMDIDETLVMTPQNCVMLTKGGLQAFESFCESSTMPKDLREQLYQRCRLMICRKILCEGARTKETIKELQEQGVWVLGLTARYATSSEDTDDMLSHFGLSLKVNCPLPTNLSLQDPETQAVYMNGVIYTNAVEKGTVLNRFLQNVVYREHVFPDKDKGEELKALEAKLKEDERMQQEYVHNTTTSLPKEIIFCDDRKDNAESVFNHLSFARKFNIPLTCYHYTYTQTLQEKPVTLEHPEKIAEAVSAGPDKLVELWEHSMEYALAVVQIAAFIKTEGMRLFNDSQAKALLEDIRGAIERTQSKEGNAVSVIARTEDAS